MSVFSLVTFQTKQTYIDMVFQIVYGLERFHKTFRKDRLSKDLKEQMEILEDWYGGDPSQNGFQRIFCVNKSTDIKRLHICSINSFDYDKWDFIKSFNKQQFSEISSNCASSQQTSPFSSIKLTPARDNFQKSPIEDNMIVSRSPTPSTNMLPDIEVGKSIMKNPSDIS